MFVGCQFSLYPMTDRFIDVILDAIADLRASTNIRRDIRVETDDLSTLIVGTPDAIFAALQHCFLRAAAGAEHVVLNVTISRGCPGEADDPLCTPKDPVASTAPILDSTTVAPADAQVTDAQVADVQVADVQVAAQFALYPLGIPNYMDVIYSEIEAAKQSGILVKAKNYCTRLDGDASQVFATLHTVLDRATREAGHIVITATISTGSPTRT